MWLWRSYIESVDQGNDNFAFNCYRHDTYNNNYESTLSSLYLLSIVRPRREKVEFIRRGEYGSHDTTTTTRNRNSLPESRIWGTSQAQTTPNTVVLTCWAGWSVVQRSSHWISGRRALGWVFYQCNMHPQLNHAEKEVNRVTIYSPASPRDGARSGAQIEGTNSSTNHLLVPTSSWKIGYSRWESKEF